MSSLARIQSGRIPKPPRILCYGVEGIGKSTLGSQAPNPIFIQTEDGLDEINCDRFPQATTLEQVSTTLADLQSQDHDYETVVIDSLDWLERLIFDQLCTEHNATSIEQVAGGYSKGYGRGMSIDFALLKCNAEFAKQVTPIPLADRYPNVESGLTTYGCPRCEWPSLQVLKLNRSEGQILSWKPEAIGGRSGSSIIDYTIAGPRVVGLLTWAGGGEGLGQSTPFILDALQGKLPASIEALPSGVREVGGLNFDFQETDPIGICRVPASTSGFPLSWSVQEETSSQENQELIDSILEKNRPKENGLLNRNRDRSPGAIQGPIARGVSWVKRVIGVLVLCAVSGGIGYFIGRRRN